VHLLLLLLLLLLLSKLKCQLHCDLKQMYVAM
jgi:hypothetical protein